MTQTRKVKKSQVIYPELSYKIVGVLFDVYNSLGYGYQEKYYYRAIAIAFRKAGLSFKEQIPIPLKYKDENIGRYYLDFLIEGKVVLEIKKGDFYPKQNFQQVLGYLKATGSKLGILASFTSRGITFKRVVNLHS